VSKSTPSLLKAIGDFHAEHGGDKEHESTISLLQRVAGDIGPRKGKAEPSDTPGSREARGAAERSMPSEAAHDGGDGQRRSNKPGSASIPDSAADQRDKSEGDPGAHMTGTGPVKSGGNLVSTLAGEAMPNGVVNMRRAAAIRGLESGDTSDGNKQSVSPAPRPIAEGRVGDVKAPAKDPADKNTGSFEGVPPFAKEPLSGDGWTRAREKARKMAPAPR
jgi:hypothetical protein